MGTQGAEGADEVATPAVAGTVGEGPAGGVEAEVGGTGDAADPERAGGGDEEV